MSEKENRPSDKSTDKSVSEQTTTTISPARKRLGKIAVACIFCGMIVGGLIVFAYNALSLSPETATSASIEKTVAETSDSSVTHDHIWIPVHDTVHHDALYEQVWHAPVYGEETTYHTVCNECQGIFDGTASAHITETGHSGYSTNVPITDEVIVQDGFNEDVLVTPEYDELVVTSEICSVCGETKQATE